MSQVDERLASAFSSPELAELFRLSRPVEGNQSFAQEFLPLVARLFGATGACLWLDLGAETLRLCQAHNPPNEELRQDAEAWRLHGVLLKSVSQLRSVALLSPGFSRPQGTNPTSSELLIAPARVDARQTVLLELFRPPDAEEQQSGLAAPALLQTAAEFAADYVRGNTGATAVPAAADWKHLDAYARQIHQARDVEHAATLIANGVGSVLNCDRVSVVVRQRRSFRVRAVSGQAATNPRSTLVRLQERISEALQRTQQAVVVGPGVRQVPTELSPELLQTYLAESKPHSFIAVPMRQEASQPAHCVLLIEQFDGRVSVEQMARQLGPLVPHAALALTNATAQEQVFLGSTRRRLGQAVQGSSWGRRLVWLTLACGLAAMLYFVPKELRMSAAGALRAAERRGVFAPNSGVVRSVTVQHGERVSRGEELLRIENSTLQVEHQQSREEHSAAEELLKVREVERAQRGLSDLRQIQLDGEIAELHERLAYLKQRLALTEQRLTELTLTAPIDGIVASWDPDQQLLDRPVQAGHLLVTVVNEEAPWRLELQLPEVDAGPVLAAWNERGPQSDVPVEYLLASHPEQTFHGRLVNISETTELRDQQSVLLLTVEPNPGSMPPLRDGTEVRAKISCGERSLGYVVFRELIEFVHSRILFNF